MRALIAFDKFKDSMRAPEACRIAAEALRRAAPDCEIDIAPLTDGGEGFARILTTARGGEIRTAAVPGPRRETTNAEWGWVALDAIEPELRQWLALPDDGGLAIVEMAQASGLQGLPEEQRDPWHATTAGTGELIREAAREGASAILLGIGGSATNDIGLGALEVLGLRFSGAKGAVREITPAKWPDVNAVGGAVMKLPRILIGCDVLNPLLGPNGAAAIYGPQKGLRPQDLSRMQEEMARMAKLLCAFAGESDEVIDEACGGAAGGIGFGFRVVVGAGYVPGFDLVSRWLRLKEKVSAADVVITGEGRFDASSLQGKGPGSLCRWAADAGKPSWVFAGQISPELLGQKSGRNRQLQLRAISPTDLPMEQALRRGPELLAAAIGKVFSGGGLQNM